MSEARSPKEKIAGSSLSSSAADVWAKTTLAAETAAYQQSYATAAIAYSLAIATWTWVAFRMKAPTTR